MIGYAKIQRELDSLKNSTYLQVALRGETWTLDGRNSPYVSHQSVELSAGHGQRGLVVFSNGHAWLAVSLPRSLPEFTGDVLVRSLPVFHFRQFNQFPVILPGWLLNDPDSYGKRVVVAVKDGFDGFGEGREPRFKNRLSGKLGDFTLFNDYGLLVEEFKIGCTPITKYDTGLLVGGTFYAYGEPFTRNFADYDRADAELDKHGICLTTCAYAPGAGQCIYPDRDDCGDCPHDLTPRGEYAIFSKEVLAVTE